jgi:hypothetical protein
MIASGRNIFMKHSSLLGTGVLLGTLIFAPFAGASSRTPDGVAFDVTDVRSLTTWIVPAQTKGWVGVQGKERSKRLTVTPGNRFLRVLKCHAELYFDRKTGLKLSAAQKAKVKAILARTRDRLVPMDAKDLFLVQHFEAMVASPRVDVARLSRLNELIGSLEGDEAGTFVGGLKSMQGVLTDRQRKTLRAKNGEALPDMTVDLSGAVFLADRILAIRWNVLERTAAFSSDADRQTWLANYLKGRREIQDLGIEKTGWDKKSGDILEAPYVDLRALGEIEAKGGPVEGRFWETLIKTVGALNPPSAPQGTSRP